MCGDFFLDASRAQRWGMVLDVARAPGASAANNHMLSERHSVKPYCRIWYEKVTSQYRPVSTHSRHGTMRTRSRNRSLEHRSIWPYLPQAATFPLKARTCLSQTLRNPDSEFAEWPGQGEQGGGQRRGERQGQVGTRDAARRRRRGELEADLVAALAQRMGPERDAVWHLRARGRTALLHYIVVGQEHHAIFQILQNVA